MTLKRRVMCASGTLTLLVAVSSCADIGEIESTSVSQPPLGPIQVVTEPGQITLPLDAYQMSLDDTVRVDRAVYVLVTRCMGSFGFDYDEPFNERSTSGPTTVNARRYGLLDEAHAAAYGYKPGPAGPSEKDQAEATGTLLQESPEARNILGGKGGPSSYRGRKVPPGGCFGEARRQVAKGGPPFDPQLPEKMATDSFMRMENDSRVQAAYRRWSKCMAREGFDYPSSRAANNDERWSTPKPTAAEIAVAVADVRCKKRVNLVGVRMAVETAYQRQLIEQNAEALHMVETGNQRTLRNAADVLAGQ